MPAKMAEEASKFTLVKSELRNGINRILQFITYLLVPAGLLTIYTQLFTTHAGWRQAVLRTVGALVPMVPEGLVLMTSIAFAVGVVRLGQRRCLVQELPAIEGLARVDVVCADKTGTLTENGMRVSRTSKNWRPGRESLPMCWPHWPQPTPVLTPACRRSRKPMTSRPVGSRRRAAPFKSATKWSGVSYGDHGNWVIGAPDVLLDPASAAARASRADRCEGVTSAVVGVADVAVDHPGAPGRVTPVALVVLEQKLRPDARETTGFFANQDVYVKVISGDNAVSVGAVAGELGLHGETMDARQLPTDQAELADALDTHSTFGQGAARPETRHRACPAITRPHRGDDRRRRQRRPGPQGRRHRRRDGRWQPGIARSGADRVVGQQICHIPVCRR